MTLPFSHDAFLDVFGRYNTSLWPAAAVLWLVSAIVFFVWLLRGRLNRRLAFALLAVHWAWSGIAYHWLFFRGINPAATGFAVMFVLQATLFTWLTASGRIAVLSSSGVRGIVGTGLFAYGLVYPFVGLALGLEYPRVPLFAVPCPTALMTAGLLLASPGVPRFVNALPIVWAMVGSSAAFALDIRADALLLPAGLLLALDTAWPLALGPRPSA